MSDITSTIHYTAEASQAIGTMRALAVQAGQLNAIISASAAAGAAPGIPVVSSLAAAKNIATTNRKPFSPFQLPPSTEVDHLNNTLRTTVKTIALNSEGMKIFDADVVEVHGHYKDLAKSMENVTLLQNKFDASNKATSDEIGQQRQIIEERKRGHIADMRYAESSHKIAKDNRDFAVKSLDDLKIKQKEQLDSLEASQAKRRAALFPNPPTHWAGTRTWIEEQKQRQIDEGINYTRDPSGKYLRSDVERRAEQKRQQRAFTSEARANLDILKWEHEEELRVATQARRESAVTLQRATKLVNTTSADLATFLKNDPILVQARARVAELKKLGPATYAAQSQIMAAARAEVVRQNNRPPPIPSALETVRQESPKTFNRLVSQGLGVDTETGAFTTKKLAEQQAHNLTLTRDLERGTSSLRGEVIGLNGEMQEINATYAKGGREIQRYGGILSGTQNFFRQTVANLQKVVQWGIATTAVIGGIGLASAAIGNIKNLDASLNQLAITAQLSSTQTKAVFNDLAQIAYNTATPLQEMVKAADDIALATKRANQSTQDWQTSIKALAVDVGILTNITGLDTVKATDLLTATMKQLNLQASDLTGILNKVAAVAGSQANSIADVVAGLGVMAEAAQTASLSLDETIAVVQVLGQVTSKTAPEIATSFKNLVGSVDSVGGKKALLKYNIDTRDAEGNLKNILQIYEEINAAIRQGIVPAADVKDLIKAIAGGPRRAPDASALLANVGAIRAAQQRAAGATNEALVANVKYLDTINAKIIQIQVKFQTFIQNSFGPALKDFISGAADVLSSILDILSKVDSGTITTGLSILAFLATFKLLTTGINYLIGSFNVFIAGLKLVNVAAAAGTAMFLETGTTAAATSAVVVASIKAEIVNANAFATALEAQAAIAQQSGQLVIATELEKQAAIERTAVVAKAANLSLLAPGVGPGAAPISKFAKFGPAAMTIGTGAATGALLGNQTTGGSIGGTLGGGVAGLGLSLLAAPIPIPHVKALAAVLTAVGLGLTLMSGENKKVAETSKASGAEVLAAIGQYKEAQTTIAALTDVNKGLSETYQALTKDEKTSRVNAEAINDTIKSYTQNTLDLKSANEALKTSQDALLGSEYGDQIKQAASGLLDAKNLKELQKKIYTEIFSKTNPELFVQDSANNLKPSIISGGTVSTDTKNRTASYKVELPKPVTNDAFLNKFSKPVTIPATLDLSNLQNAQDILKLFSKDGKAINAEFEASAINIDAIRTALLDVAAQEGEVGDKGKIALATFENWASTLSAIGNADVFGKQQSALLATQAILGEITSEEQVRGQQNIKLYQDMVAAAEKLPKSKSGLSGPGGRIGNVQGFDKGSSEEAQKRAQDIFVTTQGTIRLGKVSIDQAREYLSSQGLIVELAGEQNKLSDDQIATMAGVVGLAVDYSSELLRQIALSEEIIAIQEDLQKLSESSTDTLASKMGDIQKQYLSGDITKKQRDSMFAGAKATDALNQKMIEFFDNVAGNQAVVDEFAATMSKVPGLENLVGKNASQAAELMANFFNSMDLTRKGAETLMNRIIKLIMALNAIPKHLSTTYTISVQTLTGNAADVYSRFRQEETGGNKGNPQKDYANYAASLQKQLNALLKQINSVGSGNGTSFLGSTGGGGGGGGSSAGAGKDVSQIDLPEELYGTKAEQQAYLKEAVKRAKALQKTIPGASKEASNDIVSILKGTQNLLTVKGVKDDLLRRALEELAAVEKKRLEFETKADTIRRIRVGAGDFAALANVPTNTKTGISLGGPQGPITISLNVTGQVLTPAQMTALANMVAAALAKNIAK